MTEQKCQKCQLKRSHKATTTTKETLLQTVQPHVTNGSNKVTVVGVGQVGMACVFSILSQKISSDVCLVDCVEDKLMGEMLDLQHGSSFLHNCKVSASTDYSVTAGSRLCIVTAGVRQREGESRLDLVQRNTEVMKNIIPNLVKYSPNTVILIVSNPVDILTYVAWKLSGLPKGSVVGTGTNLDSSRLRFFLSQKLGVASTSCHGWIIGEHGDASVVVWSGVNIAGVRLQQLNPKVGAEDDPENWKDLHKQVIESAYNVIKLKGYTSWAIGMTVAPIASSILYNDGKIHALSVLVKGYHGIDEEVFQSLPCVVGAGGITDVIIQPLTDSERGALQKSAKLISEVQNGIKF